MPLAEAIIGKLVEQAFTLVLSNKGIQSKVRERLGRDSTRRAYAQSLAEAANQLESKYPEWTASLFDASFFQHEGAIVLSQFLVRDGRPDPSELANRWATALNLSDQRRTVLVRDLEPVASEFLENFANALKDKPELRDVNDSRVMEQLGRDVQKIRQLLGAQEATPGTRWDYLRWLIARNLYLDPRGTFQTQRQVQLKLNEIYTALSAQREDAPGSADRRLREKELDEIEEKIHASLVTPEEAEALREQFLSIALDGDSLQPDGGSQIAAETYELADIVRRHQHVTILGDPGSGKTTLLRFLALKHAEALYDNSEQAGPELGRPRFPVLIRIANYTENDTWKRKSLTEFLPDYHRLNECSPSGLEDLISHELDSGRCIVLLDGLDEITNADDRRGVVERIENFVRRYEESGNRFIVTSRIAGYRTAPLTVPFLHYTVKEMEEAQIERFLKRWCFAVESAETPELSMQEREAIAQREIDGILDAIRMAPGVARLAANPLMLRILALIHRTGASLPQKRIELYKLAADTLARTWRVAQGVPESVLIQEEYLTRLLSRLAYWLHVNKSSGIATEAEVHNVLGEEWARIKRVPWEADNVDPAISLEVDKFLSTVRIQTGLFVERAPKRYGFMHLTFEEYYAARYLVARRRTSAGLIREQLQDPRWQEPILLALGFVGLDYPDEAMELLETSVLAEGEVADELGLEPSAYESVLGLDYLFALRCLADQIPVDPAIAERLMNRMVDELVNGTGSARFAVYKSTLEEIAVSMGGSEAEGPIVERLRRVLEAGDLRARIAAASWILRFYQFDESILNALLEGTHDENWDLRLHAVNACTFLPPWVEDDIPSLLAILEENEDEEEDLDDEESAAQQARASAAWAVGLRGELSDHMTADATAALIRTEKGERSVRSAATGALGSLVSRSPTALKIVLRASALEKGRGRFSDVTLIDRIRYQLRQPEDEVVDAIMATASGDGDPRIRAAAIRLLGGVSDLSPDAVPILLAATTDSEPAIRAGAASSLRMVAGSEDIAASLVALLSDSYPSVRYAAASALSRHDRIDPEAKRSLLELLDDEDATVRVAAVSSFGRQDVEDPEVRSRLLELAVGEERQVRAAALQAISIGGVSEDLIESFLVELTGDSPFRGLAAAGLARISTYSPHVISALVAAAYDVDMGDSYSMFASIRALAVRFPDDISRLSEDERIAIAVACDLEDRRFLSPQLIGIDSVSVNAQQVLLSILQVGKWYVFRTNAAELVGRLCEPERDIVHALRDGLLDSDDDVRMACARGLARLGRRFPESADSVSNVLLEAINESRFEHLDTVQFRSGQDYGFSGLWMLCVGAVPEAA